MTYDVIYVCEGNDRSAWRSQRNTEQPKDATLGHEIYLLREAGTFVVVSLGGRIRKNEQYLFHSAADAQHFFRDYRPAGEDERDRLAELTLFVAGKSIDSKLLSPSEDDAKQSAELPPPVEDVDFTRAVVRPKPGEPLDLVQKQWCGSYWETLCNVCHRPIESASSSLDTANGDIFMDSANEPVCFEIVPCYMEIQQVPPCDVGGGFAIAERWHKQREKVFVVCARCWKRIGIQPSQVPAGLKHSYVSGDVAPDIVVKDDSGEVPHSAYTDECICVDVSELEKVDDI